MTVPIITMLHTAGDAEIRELFASIVEELDDRGIALDRLAEGDKPPAGFEPVFPPANPFKPGDLVGTAVLTGNFEDGSPEWHAARRNGIGGSEIACIMGVGFKSRYILWLEKAGTIEPGEIPEKYSEWGHRHEPTILRAFQDRHPEKRVVAGGSWQHKDRPWQKASLDGLVLDQDGNVIEIVECKTSENGSGWGLEREGELGVPLKYRIQVRWYLSVMGLSKATVIVLIGPFDYREYTVHADPFVTADMLAQGQEFVELLQALTPPPIDGKEDTYNYLRSVNPSIDTKLSVEIPEEIATGVLEAKRQFDEAEANLFLWKGHAIAHMGVAKTGTFKEKPILARQARGGGIPFLVIK